MAYYSHRDRIKAKIKAASEFPNVDKTSIYDLLILSNIIDASQKCFAKILEGQPPAYVSEVIIETVKTISEMDKINLTNGASAEEGISVED